MESETYVYQATTGVQMMFLQTRHQKRHQNFRFHYVKNLAE
ncbi:TPA: hypothetical protein ACIU15_001683 [Yersinia enterocolitica]